MDSDLDGIRAKRLAELRGGAGEEREDTQVQEQRVAAENSRHIILIRILSNEARERLSRIALVKAERARAIEDFLINATRTGAIRGGSAEDGRLSESDLVNIINKIECGEEKKADNTKIKFQRRTYSDDDDDF